MLYTVKKVVGNNIMTVGHTNSSTEAELMLQAVGGESWVCDNIQEIMVG